MKRNLSRGVRIGLGCLIAVAWQVGAAPRATAQQPPATPAPAAPEAAPASTAMATPSMTGPLVANPNPLSFDGGPLNKIYFNGAISALGLFQSDPVPGDHSANGDLSNGLVSLQNTEGLVQFFVQAGGYTFPTLGTPYVQHVDRATGGFFSPVPVGYLKLVPNDTFSIQAGKLPTLIGAEYAFTFQNMNIERGLLWNQEPIVSRGIQANYAAEPFAFSVSLNDGFYSDSYNWLTGSVAWTIDKQNTLTVVGGGNFDHTDKNAVSCHLANCLAKTPFFPNNGDILNIIYTYNAAPWTITPYFQYTHVPGSAFFGTPKDASTVGGALLASYAFNDNVSLAGRWEYIGSTGGVLSPNLLYGPGSSAFSFTVTPTYQQGIFFLRADASVVDASSTTAGFAFGKLGKSQTQGRFVIETGIIF
jgi:hypothetical protein